MYFLIRVEKSRHNKKYIWISQKEKKRMLVALFNLKFVGWYWTSGENCLDFFSMHFNLCFERYFDLIIKKDLYFIHKTKIKNSLKTWSVTHNCNKYWGIEGKVKQSNGLDLSSCKSIREVFLSKLWFILLFPYCFLSVGL